MSYVAFGPLGPRPAVAVSADLRRWRRLGPVHFEYQPELDADLNLFTNKDVVYFPEAIPGPDGRLSYAMLHRPTWDLGAITGGPDVFRPAGVSDPRPGIWISYAPADAVDEDVRALAHVRSHRLVALPEYAYEALKIGAGPPPLRVKEGWLLIHHGVSGTLAEGWGPQSDARYCAGAMLLDPDDPGTVLARSPRPLLESLTSPEREGTSPNVVFPTATHSAGLRQLAGIAAGWFFGQNPAGIASYNPATGATDDGINANGTVNLNSGAESTIFGLLTMEALHASPDAASIALASAHVQSRDGQQTIEAEAASLTGPATVASASPVNTGESQWSGGAYVRLATGSTLSWTIPADDQPRLVQAVVNRVLGPGAVSDFASGTERLGVAQYGGGGAQGISPAPDALLPVTLPGILPANATQLTASTLGGVGQLERGPAHTTDRRPDHDRQRTQRRPAQQRG